jgi:Fe2+ transport system protein B
LAADLGRPVLLVSAVTGQGLDQLLRAIGDELEQRPSAAVKAALAPSGATPEEDPR